MQFDTGVKAAIDYIEQNIKAIITTEELADIAGYSVWHFCRLFARATGVPVAGYICKRRIDKAFDEISNGRRAVDASFEYGFDTYAGFYKAFVRIYGCSPKKYLALYGKNIVRNGGLMMFKENELREVLSNWDVQQNLPFGDIYIMDGSKISGNVWTVGEGYILKHGERDKLLRNLRMEKELAAQGFWAAAPILTKSGAEYVDGERVFTLSRKIPGEPLAKDDRFGDNRYEFGQKYGRGIAKLHQALATVEADFMPDEVNIYKQLTEWAIPNIKKQNIRWGMGLPDSFFDDYAESFGALFDKLPRQLIHRDPNPSNILFDNGEISGFIDFDLCERNIRLWDPCYCATGILCEWHGVEYAMEKWPLILEGIICGYDRINLLTAEEREAVVYVLCSIQMICTAYFEGIDEYRGLAKTNREILRFIVGNKDRLRVM